jgi:hypothetical protein
MFPVRYGPVSYILFRRNSVKVEVCSNTSTVALLVVGDDGKATQYLGV